MRAESVQRGSAEGHHREPNHPAGEALSVYVHVPFCASRCDYCAFVTYVGRQDSIREFVEVIESEVDSVLITKPEVLSLYFGGGTPTQMDDSAIELLVAKVRDVCPDVEVSLEANPSDVTPSRIRRWEAGGVDRVSVGVQSFDQSALDWLGRAQDVRDNFRAIECLASSSLPSFSVDLIVGGPDFGALERSVAVALEHGTPHVSAYLLTVERGTALWSKPSRHPTDDDLGAGYRVVNATLRAAGLEWYEISNWALAGHESRHNLQYWRRGDYIGLGPGAHSCVGPRRWSNIASLDGYLKNASLGKSLVASHEHLDDVSIRIERIMLGLRLRSGIDAAELSQQTLRELDELSLIELFEVDSQTRVRLSEQGRLFANEVILRLVSDI